MTDDQKALWTFAEKQGCLSGDCKGCKGESKDGCAHPEHPVNMADSKQDVCTAEEAATYV